jgi:hypothetical protein
LMTLQHNDEHSYTSRERGETLDSRPLID